MHWHERSARLGLRRGFVTHDDIRAHVQSGGASSSWYPRRFAASEFGAGPYALPGLAPAVCAVLLTFRGAFAVRRGQPDCRSLCRDSRFQYLPIVALSALKLSPTYRYRSLPREEVTSRMPWSVLLLFSYTHRTNILYSVEAFPYVAQKAVDPFS